jgi:hypothetical protein
MTSATMGWLAHTRTGGGDNGGETRQAKELLDRDDETREATSGGKHDARGYEGTKCIILVVFHTYVHGKKILQEKTVKTTKQREEKLCVWHVSSLPILQIHFRIDHLYIYYKERSGIHQQRKKWSGSNKAKARGAGRLAASAAPPKMIHTICRMVTPTTHSYHDDAVACLIATAPRVQSLGFGLRFLSGLINCKKQQWNPPATKKKKKGGGQEA